MSVFRRVAAAGTLAAAFIVPASFRGVGVIDARVPVNDARVPVVVELFTSEGCDSCPPADRLLRDLFNAQPIDIARVIILGEHVDYFNHDGWTDPFSSAIFTDRQSAYDQTPNGHGPFTPEMIVDGTIHFTGSDRQSALAAIRRAAERPKPSVGLRWNAAAGALEVTFEGGTAAAGASVLIAVTEDRLSSDVRAGENKGRQLIHDGVVRRLTKLGQTDNRGSFRRVVDVKIDKSWRGPLHVVAIVQHEAGAVMAVGHFGFHGTNALVPATYAR